MEIIDLNEVEADGEKFSLFNLGSLHKHLVTAEKLYFSSGSVEICDFHTVHKFENLCARGSFLPRSGQIHKVNGGTGI